MRGILRTITILVIMTLTLQAQDQIKLSTDKARYNPGDEIRLTIQYYQKASKAEVVVYHLEKMMLKDKIKLSKSGITTYNWIAPETDFQGYLIKVKIGKEVQSIAVDVSSDCAKYIRYGFLSKYPKMSYDEMDAVLDRLNRFHINGIQFYDYHYMHQKPVKLTNGKPDVSWADIAGRLNYSNTVEYYIQKSRQLNMTSMAYNLIYGSWGQGFDEDVKRDWLMYKDTELTQPYFLDFPESWEDDIYFLDPGNTGWQDYLIRNTKPVIDVMDLTAGTLIRSVISILFMIIRVKK